MRPGDLGGRLGSLTIPTTVADVFGQSLEQAFELGFTTDKPDGVMAGFDSEINVTKLRLTGGSDDKSQPFEGGLRWDIDAVGDFVELAVPAQQAGTDQLSGTCREYPSRGDFRVLLNHRVRRSATECWHQHDPVRGRGGQSRFLG